MFTGLIEEVGRLEERSPLDEGARLRVAAALSGELERGESVAVDGACLSVVEADPDGFVVEATRVTLDRTTLGSWEPGRRVNLERALRLGDRLGGHLVQGHVDAVGRVVSVERLEEVTRLAVRLPSDVARVTVARGSLAVDGVSLTVADLEEDVAEIAVIPQTREHTTIDRLSPGVPVNLEADLMGKYVERLARPHLPDRSVGPERAGDDPERS